MSSKLFDASKKSLIEINAKLGYAAILLISGIWMWPETITDYGWGVLSVLLIGSASGLTINAVKKIFDRENFIKQQEEFWNQGNEVKSSGLASTNAPVRKGFKVK